MKEKIKGLLETLGLHPIVGFGMIIVDMMLFGGETSLGVIAIPFTATIGFLLGVASIFIQKSLYDHDWMSAIGKGIIVGIITAIPTPIPDLVTLPFAIMGTVHVLTGSKETPSLPDTTSDEQ